MYRLLSALRGQRRLIEPSVFIGPGRCCWSRGLTDVMTDRRGGRRQMLKWRRWEAALHKSICASDSSPPGGPDNCRAARQLPGFAAKNLRMDDDVGGMSGSATNTFNPSSASRPSGPDGSRGGTPSGPSGPPAPVLDIIFNRSGLI